MNPTNTLINSFKAFKQQALGVLSIGFMIAAVYFFYPQLLSTTIGKLVCSLLVGLYIYYLQRKATKNLAAALQFIPSGESKAHFDAMISSCNMDPNKIRLRYSYTDSGIAMAMFDTVCIDPLLWNGLESDPEYLKALGVIEQYISPVIPVHIKERLPKFKQILSEGAQRFIFKHELGHVFNNYSEQKLLITGMIGVLAAFIGISVAMATISLSFGAFLLGLLSGGLADLLLSYASNLIFKLREEKNADLFAVTYSSPEDIEAAANFFEAHQKIVNAHVEPDNILALLPQQLLTGHPDGKSRAGYLRKCSA